MKLTDEEGLALYPFLILDSITWRGPILTDEEKQRRIDYMPAEEGNMQQARGCLTTLAKRAFRRPDQAFFPAGHLRNVFCPEVVHELIKRMLGNFQN